MECAEIQTDVDKSYKSIASFSARYLNTQHDSFLQSQESEQKAFSFSV